VVSDISLRTIARIELLKPAAKVAQKPLWLCPPRRIAGAVLRQRQCQNLGNRSLFNDKRAIHIGFPEPEVGVEENAQLRPNASEPDGKRLATSVTHRKYVASGCYDAQTAGMYERAESSFEHPGYKSIAYSRCRPLPIALAVDFDMLHGTKIMLSKTW